MAKAVRGLEIDTITCDIIHNANDPDFRGDALLAALGIEGELSTECVPIFGIDGKPHAFSCTIFIKVFYCDTIRAFQALSELVIKLNQHIGVRLVIEAVFDAGGEGVQDVAVL